MLEALLSFGAELAPVATWLTFFIAAVVAAFVLYVGIALRAVLRAPDAEQRQVRYQVFRDLVNLFTSRKRQ